MTKIKRVIFFIAIFAVIAVLGILNFVGTHSKKEVLFENVWIVNAEGEKAVVFMNGVETDLKCSLTENEVIFDCLADIIIKGDEIVSISIKNERISAKVLACSKDYVELEGYGRVPVSSAMKVYKAKMGDMPMQEMTMDSIIVGYNQQEFIVGDGMICGALITHELTVDNIRVLLKTSSYQDIYHKDVRLTCDGNMTVTTVKEGRDIDELLVNKGDTLLINEESGKFERVKIVSDSGEITVDSVERSYGKPSYEGSIEVVKTDNGFVVINDIDVEKYLKRVVPSEMPYTYGVEALKVQAVCARSYAYTQLENDTYKGFGAHLDDSTNYQVYNNTKEKDETNRAIAATSHQILEYDNKPAKTFYYSTSWGKTSDCTLWGSSPDTYPYYISCSVNQGDKKPDMSSNEEFEKAIVKVNEDDYEKDFPLYRWSMEADNATYSQSVIGKINARLKTHPDKTRVSQGGVSGKICGIEVMKRSEGGAVMEMKIVFDTGNATLIGENNIRYIMGHMHTEIIDHSGKSRNEEMLLSAYCMFEVGKDKIKITGGGWGHGIGMSQNAVCAMTQQGKKYNEILSFFYPGTSLVTVEASLKE